MKTIQDRSYGVVPLHQSDDGVRVLLVHQISYRGDDFWIFPKGHAEAGETNNETALRELEEETGIKNITLEPEKKFSVFYSFIHEGVKIDKTVEYYLGYCVDTKTIITQPHEIKELRWCDFAAAYDLLTHQNSKDVLRSVEKFLRSSAF